MEINLDENSTFLLIDLFYMFSSVQSLSHVWLFATPWIIARQASLPPPTPGVHSDSCPSSQWCHPAISSSVILFSSCPQSLPASGCFPMSQLFTWGGQSIRVSTSASVLPMNSQDWSLEQTGWISLQSKGLSRVFYNTTVQIALLTMPKPLTVWITINCGKFFKRMGIPDHLTASWEICMQVRR